MSTTLLIIDDSIIDRSKYVYCIINEPSANYLVLEASNLEEAKELCEDKQPEMILLGLQLTNDNGLNFLSWMKQKTRLSILPTLVLVESIDESLAVKATENGIQDYLVKDYLTPERLIRSLDNLLERVRLSNAVSNALSLRKHAEQAIVESQAKFQLLAECSDDFIWSTDLEGKFNYLSPQFQELFGWEPITWIGKAMSDLIYDSDRSHFKDYIDQISKTNKRGDSPIEFRFLQKDHSYVWVSCNVILQRNSQGAVVSIQGIIRDISDRMALAEAIKDRKQVESRLNETNEILSVINQELIQAIGIKDEFLSTVSHELRTPLHAVLGLGELLQEEIYGGLNEEQKKALRVIESSGNHLLELIENILDFSKIEVGNLKLNRTPNSIVNLCQASLDFVKYQATNKSIQLKINVADNLPEIFLDERRIRQALLHLLNNAIKFTAQGGQVAVTIKALRESWIQIAVSDTGIGIAPENLTKLFRPFVQLDGKLNRQYEGTGLGLAIVKQIIESHGGKVSVNSEVGVGSCFTVDLPTTISR